jgi:glycine C-acetyltransferase
LPTLTTGDGTLNQSFYQYLQQQLDQIEQDGLYKHERVITSPQKSAIELVGGSKVINFCANNYLGLSDSPDLIECAKRALDQYGYGMSSVRFICGTQSIHKELEKEISSFLNTEDTILYSSCFDANTGLFETLLTKEDAIISDALNHASIIDGVRLCKAKRYRYANNDMQSLEQQLQQADAEGARFKLIVTDGVFSMDGIIVNLPGVCELAEKYDALVMVDDSHAVGFVGENGGGTPDMFGLQDKVDIVTGTLGKALGGASGGYTSGKKPIIDMLRQRSRPYLFSNTLAPVIAATSLAALDIIRHQSTLRQTLQANQQRFRAGMTQAGFELVPGDHPIIPVMLYDEKVAAEMADKLLDHGVYVIAFSFPVVPKGKARIRTQISAAHTFEEIDKAIEAFSLVAKQMGL